MVKSLVPFEFSCDNFLNYVRTYRKTGHYIFIMKYVSIEPGNNYVVQWCFDPSLSLSRTLSLSLSIINFLG